MGRDLLRIRQMATESDHITETPLDLRTSGLLAGVLNNNRPVTVEKTRSQSLSYYVRKTAVHSATAVPVREVPLEATDDSEAVLRGILLADFTDAQVGEGATGLLESFARTLAEIERDARTRELHALHAQRLSHYFEISKGLTESLALEDVLDVALRSASALARFDDAAIIEVAPDGREMTIRKALGPDSARLEGKRVPADASLVGWVVQNRQYLPVPQFRKRKMRTALMGKKLDPDGVRAALVFPLIRNDQAIGAMVVASQQRDTFSDDEVQLLESVANQAALAMANAVLYRRMEEMATTDGLTQLPNHRHFQDAMDKELERTQRLKQPVSLILMDVDHFKRVNDTYGHPVGDEVLRRVAKTLRSVLQRKIDLPARYGGEEFVVLLPDTDLKGALRVADKIRVAVSKERFDGGSGEFNVTMSAGVATFPEDGNDKQILVDRADQALYQSKEGGRNRTTAWRSLPPELRNGAPSPPEPAILDLQKEHG
jgi:diguanylate cyclase (GGDEF)-like protein